MRFVKNLPKICSENFMERERTDEKIEYDFLFRRTWNRKRTSFCFKIEQTKAVKGAIIA